MISQIQRRVEMCCSFTCFEFGGGKDVARTLEGFRGQVGLPCPLMDSRDTSPDIGGEGCLVVEGIGKGGAATGRRTVN